MRHEYQYLPAPGRSDNETLANDGVDCKDGAMK